MRDVTISAPFGGTSSIKEEEEDYRCGLSNPPSSSLVEEVAAKPTEMGTVIGLTMTRRLVKIARSLRKQMTPQEVRLWNRLKTWRADGFVFRRQVPIGAYIVDFACFHPKLVIEVDGGQHGLDEHLARDAVRDAWLEGEGFRVVRVWNMDVHGNLEGVLICIRDALVAAGAVS